jgi:hypothetical protein
MSGGPWWFDTIGVVALITVVVMLHLSVLGVLFVERVVALAASGLPVTPFRCTV